MSGWAGLWIGLGIAIAGSQLAAAVEYFALKFAEATRSYSPPVPHPSTAAAAESLKEVQ
jgi:hypothetical protein